MIAIRAFGWVSSMSTDHLVGGAQPVFELRQLIVMALLCHAAGAPPEQPRQRREARPGGGLHRRRPEARISFRSWRCTPFSRVAPSCALGSSSRSATTGPASCVASPTSLPTLHDSVLTGWLLRTSHAGQPHPAGASERHPPVLLLSSGRFSCAPDVSIAQSSAATRRGSWFAPSS